MRMIGSLILLSCALPALSLAANVTIHTRLTDLYAGVKLWTSPDLPALEAKKDGEAVGIGQAFLDDSFTRALDGSCYIDFPGQTADFTIPPGTLIQVAGHGFAEDYPHGSGLALFISTMVTVPVRVLGHAGGLICYGDNLTIGQTPVLSDIPYLTTEPPQLGR